MFFSNILINIDHGAISACYDEIEDKLDMNEFQYGVLASFVFAGLTLGSFVCSVLYTRGDVIKKTLVISYGFLIISLLLFTVSNSFTFSLFLRMVTGFFQIFIITYQPVWSDTYCAEKLKSCALTMNMFSSPLGIAIGYVMTYFLKDLLSWEWSFFIQAIAIVPCFFTIVLTD